jgi:arylsulfatase A-like enzyme
VRHQRKIAPWIVAAGAAALSLAVLPRGGETVIGERPSFNPPPVPATEAGARPNVLLVIADDFGKDADPCHPEVGSEKPSMPNLESICASGVVFENVWTNPVCSPTRATMLTGLYGFRTGVTDVNDVLDPEVRTLARDLAGDAAPVPYANAFVGKWHLSGEGEGAARAKARAANRARDAMCGRILPGRGAA